MSFHVHLSSVMLLPAMIDLPLDSPGERRQRVGELSHVGCGVAHRNTHQVERRKFMLGQAKRLAEGPLPTVPLDRPAHFARNGEPQPRTPQFVGRAEQSQHSIRAAAAGIEHALKLAWSQ
jgi:hypothetical protein